jgi:hypothetical protein
MGVVSDRRKHFVLSLLGTGIVAVWRESELKAASPRAALTVSEEDQLRAASGLIAFVHRVAGEFVDHGVTRLDGDAADWAWFPDASRSADITLRLMSYSAAGDLELERFDPDALDLATVNLLGLNLRAFHPPDFFT